LERIKVEGRKVKVEVNPAFYSHYCVQKTKERFKKICQVSVIKKDDMLIVTLKPNSKVNLEILGYEFYNHLLSTAKEIRSG